MIRVKLLAALNLLYQLLIASAITLLLAVYPAQAQNEAQQVLIERGQYWLEKGDTQRANEAWEKLLLLNTSNKVALRGLAETALRANQIQKARNYLDQLKKIDPQNSVIADIEQKILLQSKSGTAALTDARQLAKKGNMDAAISKYKELLKDQVPSGDLGREYYTYLGYTDQGLAESISGLKRLEKERPNDARVSLALARHLARQEKTRLEAIKRLAKLSERNDVGAEAIKSWREAILWLGPPNKSQEIYYQNFLTQFPEDAEVKAQLNEGQKRSTAASAPPPVDPMVRRTQNALQDIESNPSQAEKELVAILRQRPNDANALGGLGVIRLRQGRSKEAKELLQQANNRGGKGWSQALEQANQQELLESAKQMQQQGNAQQAEQQYEKIIEKDPNNGIALHELVKLMLAQGQLDKAQHYLSQLEPLMRKNINDHNLQAAYRVTVAQFDLARGDQPLAQAELELALANYPSDPWIRLELARLYLRQGNNYDAERIMQGLAVGTQAPLDNIKAVALYAAETKDWQQVLRLISAVESNRLDTELIRLQKQADFQQQIIWAKQRCEMGQVGTALSTLSQQVLQLKDDISLVSALIDAFVTCKNINMALLLIDRQLLIANERQIVDLNLLRVGVLLQDKQIIQAEQLMAQVAQQLLTPDQKQSYDELAMYLAIEQARLLQAYGREQQALDVLLPWIEKNPTDLGLATLAIQLYMNKGKTHLAKRLYQAALVNRPLSEDTPTNFNLARLAYQVGDMRRGDAILEQIAAQAGGDEAVLVEVAKTYKKAGRMSQAAKVIKKAMTAYK